jgi:hypothetical protein
MLLVSRLPLFPMYRNSRDLSLLRDAKACWLQLSRLGYTLSVNGRMRKAVYLCPLGTCLENLKHAFHDISDTCSSCFVAETVSSLKRCRCGAAALCDGFTSWPNFPSHWLGVYRHEECGQNLLSSASMHREKLVVSHRRCRGRRTRSCREKGLAAMHSPLDLDVPSRPHHRAYVFDDPCIVPLDLLWFLCASSARCGLGSRPPWTDDLDDQQQHVHRPQVPSSVNIPSPSPSSVISESVLVHCFVRVVRGGVGGGARTKTSNTQRPPSPWAEQGREARLCPFYHRLQTQSYSLNGRRHTVPRTRSCVCSRNGCAGRLCRRTRSKVSSQQPLCEDRILCATVYQLRTRPLSGDALSCCTMPLPLHVLRFSVPM